MSLPTLAGEKIQLSPEKAVESAYPAFLAAENLTLDQAIDYAQKHSPAFQSAQYQYDEAKSKRHEAFTSFLPTLSGSGSYTRLDKTPAISFDPTAMGAPPGTPLIEMKMGNANNYNYQLSVQQPIFMGGMIVNGYRISAAMEHAQKFQAVKAKNKLKLDVKKAYYGYIRSCFFLAVADTSLKQLEAMQKQTENMFGQGMVPEATLLQVKAQVSNIKLMCLQASHGSAMALEALKNTIGMRAGERPVFAVSIQDIEKDHPQFTREAIAEPVLKNHYDLKTLQEHVRAAEMAVNISRAKYFPSLVAIANEQWKNPNSLNQTEFESSWNVTLAANMTIWNWTATQQRVFQAKMQAKQAQKGLEQLQSAAELQITMLHNQYNEACEKVQVAKEGLTSAERSYSLTFERYKQGMITNSEVLDAQRQTTQAQADYYGALIDREIALAEIDFYAEE